MACLTHLLGCAPANPPVEPPPPTAALSSAAPAASPGASGMLRLTPLEAQAREQAGESLLVVDIRPVEAFRDEHVLGAVNAPWKDLPEGHAMLPRDRLLLLYCT